MFCTAVGQMSLATIEEIGEVISLWYLIDLRPVADKASNNVGFSCG